MELDLELDGRPLRVRLASTDGGWVAAVGDEAERRVVALRSAPPAAGPGGAVVETHVLDVDGRIVEVVTARTADRILVAIAGRSWSFSRGEAARGTAAGARGSGTITAPMPGKVLAVLVAPGDAVEAGQPLVVLEAMKMETTFAAEGAGTVRAVHVVPGATVDAGAPLVEVGPAA